MNSRAWVQKKPLTPPIWQAMLAVLCLCGGFVSGFACLACEIVGD